MTGIGVNNVGDRLRDVNDMWLERKVTCQICGGRLVNIEGLVPNMLKVVIVVREGELCPFKESEVLQSFI